MRNARSLMFALFTAALPFVGGCHEETESLVNSYLEEQWDDASKKADMEADAEDAIEDAIEASMNGQVMQNFLLFKVTFDGVYNMDVDMGDFGPTVDITSEITEWESSTFEYYTFDMTASWASGNDARVDFDVSLGNWPDADVCIRSMSASITASVYVCVRKSDNVAWASVTIDSSTIDLTATATTDYFWGLVTLKQDLSDEVKDSLGDDVLEEVLEEAIEAAAEAM